MKRNLLHAAILSTTFAATPLQAAWEFGGQGAVGHNPIYGFRGADLGSDRVGAPTGVTVVRDIPGGPTGDGHPVNGLKPGFEF